MVACGDSGGWGAVNGVAMRRNVGSLGLGWIVYTNKSNPDHPCARVARFFASVAAFVDTVFGLGGRYLGDADSSGL